MNISFVRFYAWLSILGGLDSRLHTPRRDEPRVNIDAGSVGIANNQTGFILLIHQVVGKLLEEHH